MSNTPQTEAMRLADAIDPFTRKSAPDHLTSKVAADELRRLDAIEQRYNEMMTNPCPEWDGKAYMQAIANLRAQLAKAVAEEREACAKVCDERALLHYKNVTEDELERCAAAIRARSNT